MVVSGNFMALCLLALAVGSAVYLAPGATDSPDIFLKLDKVGRFIYKIFR
jgi:hypothetical protein